MEVGMAGNCMTNWIKRTYYVLYVSSHSHLSEEVFNTREQAEFRKKAYAGLNYKLTIVKRTRHEIVEDKDISALHGRY